MTTMAQEYELRAKVGPRTFKRVVNRLGTEEISQSELVRRALGYYLDMLDEKELRQFSLMQAQSETHE